MPTARASYFDKQHEYLDLPVAPKVAVPGTGYIHARSTPVRI